MTRPETQARARAGQLQCLLEKSQQQTREAVAELKAVRRTAKEALLVQACDDLFAQAERESAGLEEDSPRRQPLRSLLEHREGQCVFLDQPAVPLTNNAAERVLRLRVILRRLTFGSDSELGARTIATRHSVFGTLKMNRIEVLPWLNAWLTACAAHGGSAPSKMSAWLPGSMSPAQRQRFLAPPG